MKGFRLDPAAIEDLQSIYDFLADRSPRAARKNHAVLLQKFRLLARNPLLGELREDLFPRLRLFTTGNYVICYRPTAHSIQVLQVMHAAQDMEAVLRRPSD